MGPPRRVRRSGRRDRFVRGVAAADAGRRHDRRQRRRSAASKRSWTRSCRDRPRTVVAYALTEADPRGAGTCAASPTGSAPMDGPRHRSSGRITSADPDGTTLEIHGLDPSTGRRSSPGSGRPAGTTPPMRSPWPGRPCRWACRRPRSSRRSGRSRASDDASSARARRPGSWSTTITAITRPPSARRWRRSASANRAAACGRSTSR